jgi:hypothetical protein
MGIEWDSHPVSHRNRGTDGEGLIAHYDALGPKEKEKVVRFEFHFFLEPEGEVQGAQLAQLSQEIGDLIHKHLG